MGDNRWFKGPPFLQLHSEYCPRTPLALVNEDMEEQRKPITCLNLTAVSGYSIREPAQADRFKDLVHITAKSLHGVASMENQSPSAEKYQEAELMILRSAQGDSFLEEIQCLTKGKSFPSSSRQATLAPEFDKAMQVIRVGGMDCFGPLIVKFGRRNEKRWGILFKCLTTRAVHIEVLTSLDTDSFLMSLKRFISRRGKPAELLSDQGTNFKGEIENSQMYLMPCIEVSKTS
ncbi:hypothetical protein QQF64_013505 [Cirrhinus molitorella]|uniref:Integrase catalytic domain-containing protein n=1 Tax=Cirrhinus molitorella TaxID=172907 RepID=A0ABR3LUM4_9TELE